MPVWRNPVAWFGLAALAIPIIVHLLARMRATVLPFPSLRFIDVSRLAARKRRTLSDLPLLALRLLALLLAIAACADPLFLTPARRTAWSARVSRAIVIDTSASMSGSAADTGARTAAATGAAAASPSSASPSSTSPSTASPSTAGPATATPATSSSPTASSPTASAAPANAASPDAVRVADREAQGALRATLIRSASLRDGVQRAAAWLRTAPPSRREIVLVSDFQPDTINAGLLRDVPDDVGLRFLRVGQTAHERTADARPVSTRSASGFAWSRAQVHIDERSTSLTNRAAVATLPPIVIASSNDGLALTPFDLHLTVTPTDRPAALATLEAVLAEGVPAPAAAHADHRVELHLGGTLPTSTDLTPVSSPWMADVLQRIAQDRVLADASTAATASVPAAAPLVAPLQGTSSPAAAAPAAPTGARVVIADGRGGPLLLAAARARETRGLVLMGRIPIASVVTPLLVRSVLRALAEPDGLSEAEVRTIPDSALAAWTREAPEPSIDALRNVEDSDRRWVWAGVLVVLVIETWLRRDRQRTRSTPEPVEAHEHAA